MSDSLSGTADRNDATRLRPDGLLGLRDKVRFACCDHVLERDGERGVINAEGLLSGKRILVVGASARGASSDPIGASSGS